DALLPDHRHAALRYDVGHRPDQVSNLVARSLRFLGYSVPQINPGAAWAVQRNRRNASDIRIEIRWAEEQVAGKTPVVWTVMTDAGQRQYHSALRFGVTLAEEARRMKPQLRTAEPYIIGPGETLDRIVQGTVYDYGACGTTKQAQQRSV